MKTPRAAPQSSEPAGSADRRSQLVSRCLRCDGTLGVMAGEFAAALVCAVMALSMLLLNRRVGNLVGAAIARPGKPHPYIRLRSGRYLMPDLGAALMAVFAAALTVAGLAD